MKYSMEQTSQLIGISVDMLRHKIKFYPWRVPQTLPRKSPASPFKFDSEVVKAWLQRREEARQVSGNSKMTYLGSTVFDGVIAGCDMQEEKAQVEALVRGAQEAGSLLTEDELRTAAREAVLDRRFALETIRAQMALAGAQGASAPQVGRAA